MLETASKSMHNWRHYPSSKCHEIDENVLFRIWHSAVVPSDAAEKNVNMGVQLQSLRCTAAPKIFSKNLHPLWLLARTNLFVLSRFWTNFMNFDNCCQRYIAMCGNQFLYRCTSTFLDLNYWGGILFKSHSYLYEVVHTKFSADFWTFCKFRPQFDENCGTTWQRKCELSSISERGIPYEKTVQTASKSTNKPTQHNTWSNYVPSNAQHAGFRVWQTEKTNTTFSHLQPAHRSISPKLCMVIQEVETIEKGGNHFSIQCSFPTGCTV